MRCENYRLQLSERWNGELPDRAARELEAHLGRCGACREAAEGFTGMMADLGREPPPDLPPGFAAAVHAVLVESSRPSLRAITEPPPRPLLTVGRWALAASLLMALGAGVMALALWGSGRLGRGAGPAPGAVASGASRPVAAPAEELALGQVRTLRLTIHATEARAGAELRIVLPDGLTMVGDGAVALEERQLTWTADLRQGENVIRIPVKAERPGTFRLVARARSAGFETSAEAVLRVKRT